MSEDVSSAVKFFRKNWAHWSVFEVTTGHIHRSFLVTNSADPQSLFLQRFNTQVFPRYETVFSNVEIICDELARTKYPFEIPAPLSGEENQKFFRDTAGFVWRAFVAIPDSYSIDVADTNDRVHEAASAFSKFQKGLKDIEGSRVQDPIVGFMDNPSRFSHLQEAIKKNICARVESCRAEINFVESHQAYFNFIRMSRDLKGNHPRVTHGDMKLNNVLFQKGTDRAKSIIDLDTCMVGDYLYDYGDFMRIACATCVEDESDVEKININAEYVQAAISGFKEGFSDALPTPLWSEVRNAAAEVTLTIATRFLTDYLNGDTYFRVKYGTHNLVRAKCQLELFKRWTK